MKRRAWVALLLVLALVAAACGGDDDSGGDTTTAGGDGATTTAAGGDGQVAQRDYRFVVVSHGQSSDPFWSVAANGVNAAADDMGVTVEYQAPGTFDMVEMSQIIDAAVASQPDGLVVTIPDADALGPSIEAAVAAGIPVISMNSGSDDVRATWACSSTSGRPSTRPGSSPGRRWPRRASPTRSVSTRKSATRRSTCAARASATVSAAASTSYRLIWPTRLARSRPYRRCAAVEHRHQRHPDARPDGRRPCACCARCGRPARHDEDRYVRPRT